MCHALSFVKTKSNRSLFYTQVCVCHVMPPTSSLLNEVLFHVVTVNLGATEDYGLIHLMLFDGPHCVLAFQQLDGF